MGKERVHNEWFQSSVEGKCDCCGSNKKSRTANGQDIQVYIWGEYVVGKWRRIQNVCENCFASHVIPRLLSHMNSCGCKFALAARGGHSLPAWIKMQDTSASCNAA